MAALGRGEMGSRERVVQVNNLRIEIRMRSTAYDGYFVRESWSVWRKLDSSAGGGNSAQENLESHIEWVPRPSPMAVFLDYKPGGIAVLLSRH
jgi:hypothetical protein